MKYLLIDDNPVDLMVQEKVLSSWDKSAQITKASSGERALEMLIHLTELPDIILLDINMPIMGGFEFIEEYKNIFEEHTSCIRIYMVSSSLDPSDIKRAEDENCVSGYLIKPLSMEEAELKLEVHKNG